MDSGCRDFVISSQDEYGREVTLTVRSFPNGAYYIISGCYKDDDELCERSVLDEIQRSLEFMDVIRQREENDYSNSGSLDPFSYE